MPSNLDIFREFLESFPSDRPRSIEMLAEDAVMFIPYPATGLDVRRLDGRDAIAPVFMMAYQLYRDFRWTGMDLHATDDPSLVIGTGSSHALLKDGSVYENSYCFIGRIRDGLICEFTEFFDPRPIYRALALEGQR